MRSLRLSLVAVCVFSFLPLVSFLHPVDVAAQQEETPPARVRVLENANLRLGPGTTYGIAGSAVAGDVLPTAGCNESCDWYKLENGKWIAAFLVQDANRVVLPTVTPAKGIVTNAVATPASVTVDDAAAAPAEAPVSEPTASVFEEMVKQWQAESDLNVTQTCGYFEYKVTDVRRIKSVWWYDEEYFAQGEWLLVFVEVKNISSGTSYFGTTVPRLAYITEDGAMNKNAVGDSTASSDASWMYQYGRFYENLNPGEVLGLVEAYDIPLEPERILGFGTRACENDLLNIGVWSMIPRPDPK